MCAMRRATSSHDNDVDCDCDCDSCWTTVSSEEDTAEDTEMDAVCCFNKSQNCLSGSRPCCIWFLGIVVSNLTQFLFLRLS